MVYSFDDGVDFLGFYNLTNEETEAFTAHYRYNGHLFSVLMSNSPPEGYEQAGGIEHLWMDRLLDLSFHHGDVLTQLRRQVEGELEVARELKDVVFPASERLVLAPAPAVPESSQARTNIAQYLFPHRIYLEVATKNEKLEVLPSHHEDLDQSRILVPRSAISEVGFELGSLPSFAAHHVSIGSRLVVDPAPMEIFNVSVPGINEELVAKVAPRVGHTWHGIKREIEIYARLRGSQLDPEVRVPEFKGLITHGDGIAGFIIAKIPTKYPSLRPILTGQLEGAIPSLSLRKKWAKQIEFTVKELHRHGVVWGDAKPDNVAIDVDDNAWVLDFGGGGTPGWMDPSTYETKEGDLNVVARIETELLCIENAK
ncbi:hypothetical protein VTG60DRAFT_3003 [Thermothelomyces hinnuleus]